VQGDVVSGWDEFDDFRTEEGDDSVDEWRKLHQQGADLIPTVRTNSVCAEYQEMLQRSADNREYAKQASYVRKQVSSHA
jgi:hypothetical protein